MKGNKISRAGSAIAFVAVFIATGLLTGCKGRTADNMVPTGETVRVVIPTDDVAQDSALAAGDTSEVL